jgi:hypothetical protein
MEGSSNGIDASSNGVGDQAEQVKVAVQELDLQLGKRDVARHFESNSEMRDG